MLWSVYESFDLAQSKLNNKSFGLSSKAVKLENLKVILIKKGERLITTRIKLVTAASFRT